jgi:hypothetical protein
MPELRCILGIRVGLRLFEIDPLPTRPLSISERSSGT